MSTLTITTGTTDCCSRLPDLHRPGFVLPVTPTRKPLASDAPNVRHINRFHPALPRCNAEFRITRRTSHYRRFKSNCFMKDRLHPRTDPVNHVPNPPVSALFWSFTISASSPQQHVAIAARRCCLKAHSVPALRLATRHSCLTVTSDLCRKTKDSPLAGQRQALSPPRNRTSVFLLSLSVIPDDDRQTLPL